MVVSIRGEKPNISNSLYSSFKEFTKVNETTYTADDKKIKKMYSNVTVDEIEKKDYNLKFNITDGKNLFENAEGNAIVSDELFNRNKLHIGDSINVKDENGKDLPKTVISREYSSEWKLGDEPYYPVNDEKNGALYQKYRELAMKKENVIFGGRLGEYKYYDMDATVAAVLDCVRKLF